jgi:rRNA small subunit pseudouridine methyltransferase Nep1
MLTIILAESALELIPKQIQRDREILIDAKKRGKHPGEMLLDSSKHFAGMKGLKNEKKRGRPDIIHFALLMALDSSLNIQGKMKIYVHTYDDKVLEFDQALRLPRVYNRFIGLIEGLLLKGKIESSGKEMAGKVLMEAKEKTLGAFLDEIRKKENLKAPDFIVMDPKGKQLKLSEFSEILKEKNGKNKCVIIGGFPHETFEFNFPSEFQKISIAKEELSVWNVVAAAIFAYELAEEK